jgi:uncharacterized protein (TIGR02646 family)
MRKLDRSAVAAPACLDKYHHGRDHWEDVSWEHKEEIRVALERLQGRRCAYCEGPLDALGQHIEHFRRRGKHTDRTFVWENLYWSCYQEDSCGRHKDMKAGAYDENDLIAPCADDPDKFFRFRSNGTIDVRGGLSPQDERRARETLRVFNLDPHGGRLRSMRQRALAVYRRLRDELRNFPDDDVRAEYIAHEIQCTSHDPFSTAIRHSFEDI